MIFRELVNSQPSLMTKQELVAALTHDPIVIEQVGKLTCYRVALHGARGGGNSVLIGLAPVAGALLPEDYGQVYARVDGRLVNLNAQEAAAIVARLRRLFARGEPKAWPVLGIGGPRSRRRAAAQRAPKDGPR